MKTISRKQSGFTLIELMIVVTIIGILASIAVPAYRDYTIRTRVGEAASVFYPIKSAISFHVSNVSKMPSSLANLSENAVVSISPNSEAYKGEYVSILTINRPTSLSTTVRVTMKPDGRLGEAADKTVDFVGKALDANFTVINWITSGTVPKKYQP